MPKENEDEDENEEMNLRWSVVAGSAFFTFCFLYILHAGQDGRWLREETSPSTKLSHRFTKEDYWEHLSGIAQLHHEGEEVEGYMWEKEANYYQRLGSLPFVRTVCEIGFNGGHSSAMWLTAGERTLKLYSFDLGQHKYTPIAKKFLDMVFPDRIVLTLGDSTQSVPAFTNDEANKEIVCDIIHVDGGHFGDVPLLDLRNMRALAGTNTILLIDDVHCPESYWCADPQKAWDQMKAEGEIEECKCFALKDSVKEEARGWCVGRYLHPGHTTHKTSNVCPIISLAYSTI